MLRDLSDLEGVLFFQGKSFLVIEAAPDTQLLIRHYLTRAGAEVEFAENGLEGYRKALKGQYDVIIMDLQMPIMDGYEAIRILRQSGIQTPVIAWTAHAMKEDRERCMELGFTDYLAKPMDPLRMIETLRFYAGSDIDPEENTEHSSPSI